MKKGTEKKISSSVGAFKGKGPLQSSSRMNRKGKIQLNIRVIQLLIPFFILFSGSRKCWWPKVGKSGKRGTTTSSSCSIIRSNTQKRNGFIYLRANGNQTTIYEIYWLLNYLFSFNEWKGRKMKGYRRSKGGCGELIWMPFHVFDPFHLPFFPFCYFPFLLAAVHLILFKNICSLRRFFSELIDLKHE